MSQMKFAVQHDRSLEEARSLLESTVADAQSKFGFAIDRVEWSQDKSDDRCGEAHDTDLCDRLRPVNGDLTSRRLFATT